mgnify:CR=1 FL=1
MAKKITRRSKLKNGNIIRYKTLGGYFVGIVVREETFLKEPGFIAIQIYPASEITKELKKDGVDEYQRIHLKDLELYGAEVIKPIELVSIYRSLLDKVIYQDNLIRTLLNSIGKKF